MECQHIKPTNARPIPTVRSVATEQGITHQSAKGYTGCAGSVAEQNHIRETPALAGGNRRKHKREAIYTFREHIRDK